MFISRTLSKKLKQIARDFPVVALTGPRQSGKTTLLKHVFPNRKYVSLEDIDTRSFAQQDPRGFLETYREGAIFDEAQRAPELFSYIQGIVDEDKRSGQFILSGSQNFLLHDAVSQSLAGRVGMLSLLPLSISEIRAKSELKHSYEPYLFQGFYPRLYESKIDPHDWYPQYIQTYIERDVRALKHITDLSSFQTFVRLCAGRVGQILNLSSLANDCGITHNTARSWLSVLEASFIAFTLKPYHKSFNKRLIKSPKLYFYDPGLAASLVGISNASEIATHHLRGPLFECLILSEFMKCALNAGELPRYFFWRDKTGNEVDCVIESGSRIMPVEIKSGSTISQDYFKSIEYFNGISKGKAKDSFLVYGGSEKQNRASARVLGWQDAADVLK